MIEKVRIAVAQATYGFVGALWSIRVPRRSYRMLTSFDEFRRGEPLSFEFAGWWRGPLPGLTQLLAWSADVDPHWDHWALVHEDCEAVPCTTCGGYRCESEEVDVGD